MKTQVRRSCGHSETIKVYVGGTLKTEVIVGREALKVCKNCKAEKAQKKQ